MLESRLVLEKSRTKRLDDCNEVTKVYRDKNTDTVTKKVTYHTDVAQNIYLPDGTVIAMFNGQEVPAKDRLALCRKIASIITGKTDFEIDHSVPNLHDGAPRHSVHWLNYQGVRALNGNKVKNR